MLSFSLLTFLFVSGALAAPQPFGGPGNQQPTSVSSSSVASSTGGATPGGGSCKSPDTDSGQPGLRIGNKSNSPQNYFFATNLKNDCSQDGHGSAMGYQVFKCVTVGPGAQGFVLLDKSWKGKVIQGPKNPVTSLDIKVGDEWGSSNGWGYGTYVEVNMDMGSCGWSGAGIDVSLNAGYDTSPVVYNLDSDVTNPGTFQSLKFGSVQTAGFGNSLWDSCGNQAKSRPDNTKYIPSEAASCISGVLSKQVLTAGSGQVAYWGGAGSGVPIFKADQSRVAADFHTFAQSGAPT